jgi:endonuclease/exonuclease/phosphatase family metal-dependent hydrolase
LVVAVSLRLRVLTWNLFHGRSVPGAGHDLYDEFAGALRGWEWDVALLQEVPPWWPARLAEGLGCEQRTVLTSRNGLLAVRRAVAQRAPDAIKANGGGANAILCRSDRIIADRAQRLCRRPERRWVHGVGLACGVWVSNLHATAGDETAARRDVAEAVRASRTWAREHRARLIVGGDLNLRSVSVEGLRVVASSEVDWVLAGELVAAVGEAGRPARGSLSDHVPLAVEVEFQVG